MAGVGGTGCAGAGDVAAWGKDSLSYLCRGLIFAGSGTGAPDSSRQNFVYARFLDALLAASAPKHGLRRFLDALLTKIKNLLFKTIKNKRTQKKFHSAMFATLHY
jgi:hypothetical protein